MKARRGPVAALLAALCALSLVSCSPAEDAPPPSGGSEGIKMGAGKLPGQTQSLNTPVQAPPEDNPTGDDPTGENPPAGSQPESEQSPLWELPPGVEDDLPDEELVEIAYYIPSLLVELRYATEDNFTGQVIYDFENALLRYGTVKKLMAVQEELLEQGLSLKIWDAFRPRSAQYALWRACPDSRYVANPTTGSSTHSRGNTVDLTLVTAAGEEVEMPSGFDEFSALADRDYSDVTDEAAANARLLEDAMTAHGFKPYDAEWWHYADEDSYPVVTEFE